MQIANPIYDVVFKYLMNDNRIARMIISAIIGEDIEYLEFKSTESSMELEYKSLTVYRLDFSARIRTPGGGSKQVIIEIQKAKMPTDIMRFRRYLGEQYSSEQNLYYDHDDEQGRKKALPIISIYFLGHKLEHTDSPLIKIDRKYYDMTTQEEITEREEFIESLTHDSYVIQIPYLKERRRNELERLLSVFDQSARSGDDYHILNIREEDYPVKYREIIRKLQRAILEPEIRKVMDVEDEILEELQNQERIIALKDKALEEKDKIIEDKDKVIEDKDKVIEDKDKALEEKNRIIEQTGEALEKQIKTIAEKERELQEFQEKLKATMKNHGLSDELIEQMLKTRQ